MDDIDKEYFSSVVNYIVKIVALFNITNLFSLLHTNRMSMNRTKSFEKNVCHNQKLR